MVTHYLFCTCFPELPILGKLYVKYKYVILMYDPLSWKCTRLCLGLLTSEAVLQSWESVCWVIIFRLAWIKFFFFFFFWAWVFIEYSSTYIAYESITTTHKKRYLSHRKISSCSSVIFPSPPGHFLVVGSYFCGPHYFLIFMWLCSPLSLYLGCPVICLKGM